MFAIGTDITPMRIQIRNSSILMYYQQEKTQASYTSSKSNFNSSETYKGEVTLHAKKRIERAVNLFLQMSPVTWLYNPITKNKHQFKLSFITLTISNKRKVIDHAFAYKHLLKPFLTWMRDTKKINTYIWKAEIQARGQLHYHITLNQFLHLGEIKEKWNYLQNKANILHDYTQEYKHSNPNSIDVHSVIKIQNIEAYLCKYLSKHLNKNKPRTYYENNKHDNNANNTNTYTLINNGKNKNDDDNLYNVTCKEQRLIDEIIHGNLLCCTQANYFGDYTVNGKVWDCSNNLKGKKYFTIHTDKNTMKRLLKHLEGNEYKEYTNDYCMIVSTNNTIGKSVMNKDQSKHYDNYIQSLK